PHAGDAPERVAAHVPQDLDGDEPGEQPPLHVADARPERSVARDRERPFRGDTLVEDRVHVAQKQHPRAARPIHGSYHRVAQRLPAAALCRTDPLDAPSAPAESFLAEVGDAVDPIAVERSTVDVDHRLELREIPIAARADAVTD